MTYSKFMRVWLNRFLENKMENIPPTNPTRDAKLLSDIKSSLSVPTPFDRTQHDSESRLKITTLFLKWYFWLIAGAFLFTGFYNFIAAWISFKIPEHPIPLLEVTNTVSLITTTLSSGVGFVIGYYFKNKDENNS